MAKTIDELEREIDGVKRDIEDLRKQGNDNWKRFAHENMREEEFWFIATTVAVNGFAMTAVSLKQFPWPVAIGTTLISLYGLFLVLQRSASYAKKITYPPCPHGDESWRRKLFQTLHNHQVAWRHLGWVASEFSGSFFYVLLIISSAIGVWVSLFLSDSPALPATPSFYNPTQSEIAVGTAQGAVASGETLIEWKTFVSCVIQSVAWPVAALAIAFLLRQPIADLLVRLRKLKHGDTEAEFETGLVQAEQTADELKIPPPSASYAVPVPAPGTITPMERYQRLAAVSPGAAVLEAWRDLELAIDRLYEKQKGQRPQTNNERRSFLNDLASRQLIPQGTAIFFQQLQNLRNRAAHAHVADPEITMEQAMEFCSLALRLMEGIRRAEEERKL